MSADLGHLLGEVGAVSLDFDGPVCSVFAGYPAPQVAAELVDMLRRRGVDVPPDLAGEPDPLEVLRGTGAAGNHGVTRAVEDALCEAERRAVETAARCVLIEDSLSDIEGARAAGVVVIGHANRPAKVDAFRLAGADALVTSMGEIAAALINRGTGNAS
ncbi:hypothetical protein [Melissospora conviva]|uniref:hypothetical protein n=1 Tax=Melissospora conviva TaxID=3388432 RepID=UPI003C251F4C